MNVFSDSFYSTELGLPLLLLLLTRSDRLAPYCFFTFLAGTHNYLAGIHNYFFTIRTMTTVHHGLPLGRSYCTISFFFFGVLPKQMASQPPQDFDYAEPGPSHAECAEFSSGLLSVCFLFFLCSDDCAMGFPDSSCLFFDLIPFVYLLS